MLENGPRWRVRGHGKSALRGCESWFPLRAVALTNSNDLSADVAPSVDSALLGKPSIQAETAVVKKSAPANALKAAKPVAKETLVKVTDLSDLSVAAKKRRALAACKKPPTRKFAAMGSESRCTEQVMKGEYGPIIEALEYGK